MPAMSVGKQSRGTPWLVLPTYNEAKNIEAIVAAAGSVLGAATAEDYKILIVDDGSPDGTGRLADTLAAADERIRVRHRSSKQGLGRAYLDGFQVALDGGADLLVQMGPDWPH